MNPFNLPGPQFLALYVTTFAVTMGVAVWLRWHLRQPADEPDQEALDLSPYEVAYLAGKDEQAFNTAVVRLVHENALAVSDRKLTHGTEPISADASELELAVHSAVNPHVGESVAAVRSQVGTSALRSIKYRLEKLGLLVGGGQAWKARFVPLLLLLLVILCGVIKIDVGLSRYKPVEFLVLLCIFSVVVACAIVGRSVHRSRRGDRALARLKDDNAALQYQAGSRIHELTSDDLVLALGLFGTGILAGSPLAELQVALKPPPNASGGSSCGSSGCGGGGCGGGCGGGGCGGCGG